MSRRKTVPCPACGAPTAVIYIQAQSVDEDRNGGRKVIEHLDLPERTKPPDRR
jgi:hypothetical protein